MIRMYPMEWILEIQTGKEPEGPICKERIVVKREDEGGEPFFTMRTENLEPNEDYDENTVALDAGDIEGVYDAIKGIMDGLE